MVARLEKLLSGQKHYLSSRDEIRKLSVKWQQLNYLLFSDIFDLHDGLERVCHIHTTSASLPQFDDDYVETLRAI